MDLAEQARKDPRVGDKWESSQGIVEIKDVNENFVFAEWSNNKGETARHLRRLWPSIVAPWWTLAERGPAPKTDRDPHTTPVVGDEWAKDGEFIRVILLSSDARVIQQLENERGQTTKWSTPVKDWPTWVDGWHLHRRGDDPSWRPATNTDVNVPWKVLTEKDSEKVLDAIENGEMRVDWPIKPPEQPAAGIKVGDRVRSIDRGDEGVVDKIDNKDRIWVQYDDGDRRWMPLSYWRDTWTIIPPAAPEPDQDDTGDEPPTLDVVTNANGARQSRLDVRCDLLPPKATLRISAILRQGAERYGDTNYLGISTADHLNHALTHVLQYLAGDVSEDHLGNAAARMLFALETKGSK